MKKRRIKIDGEYKWLTVVLDKKGEKMVVDFDEGVVYVWADSFPEGELWVRIDPSNQVFTSFFLSKLSMYELIEKSKLSLYKRARVAYNHLKKIKENYEVNQGVKDSMKELFFRNIRAVQNEYQQKLLKFSSPSGLA